MYSKTRIKWPNYLTQIHKVKRLGSFYSSHTLMEKLNRKDLFTKTELILSYLYRDINKDIEQAIDKLICLDEELSIFYEDLMLFIIKTNAGKDEMRIYLEDMQKAKARFNSKLLPL